MNNFFFNPPTQMPPGLSKKPSPPLLPPFSSLTLGQTQPFSQDPNFYQASNIEKLNQFLNDPTMRQLLKDIINHTNVKSLINPKTFIIFFF